MHAGPLANIASLLRQRPLSACCGLCFVKRCGSGVGRNLDPGCAHMFIDRDASESPTSPKLAIALAGESLR
jgi:hypothetical protein